jgi:uncharacterized protein (TIGR02145 family)
MNLLWRSWIATVLLSLFLAACGDDSSSSGTDVDGVDTELSSEGDVSSSSVLKPGSSAGVEDESLSSGELSEHSSSSFVKTWDYLNPEISYEEIVDKRDSQVYKIVKIGNQWWMAENLNYRYLEPNYKVDSSSFCYNDSIQYCEKSGRLYLWSAAVDGAGLFSDNAKGCGYGEHCEPILPVRGACPKGWHLPTKEEWKKLVEPIASGVEDRTTYWSYLGASVELKTADGWKEYSTSTSGTNASGFSALPAGFMYIGEFFRSKGIGTFFWSSSVYGTDKSYCLRLQHDDDSALLWGEWKKNGFSVRCIKDSE